MEDEWEEEEQLVVVELSGVINNDFLSKCRGTCKILDIDSDKPMMQVGQYVFVGEYEEDTQESTADLKYNCHTVKRLKMQRIFLTEKKDVETSTGQKDVPDCVEDQDSLDCSHEGKLGRKEGEQQGNTADDPTVE
ncbi:General transcription factor 3C polypeptide 6 [Merluccius polli]|uniref:General transcription factor 3C polypeptide 6 n=1 Tax=Merluccius polli TaxID=89951 RepID=A0AA47MER7_MERPO|nr:General transcription factor 3C polypeptide 6 [Merluccius polli]